MLSKYGFQVCAFDFGSVQPIQQGNQGTAGQQQFDRNIGAEGASDSNELYDQGLQSFLLPASWLRRYVY
jgi:hypothetical protein